MKKINKAMLFTMTLIMMVVCMCFGTSAVSDVIVDSGECGAEGDNVTWVLYDDGELVISGEGEMADYSGLDSPFEGNSDIKTIAIESGVTSIGDYAFLTCKNLSVVNLSEDLISIGVQSFYWCENLSYIFIPKNIAYIAESAFDSCIRLSSIEVDKDNRFYSSDGNNVLFNKDKSLIIEYPVGNQRTSYEIPVGVKTIGSGAFEGAINLASIIIPDSVYRIEKFAFNECLSLTGLIIPEGVNIIEWCAFQSCTNLERVKLPESLTKIGKNAFSGCWKLESIVIPSNIDNLDDNVFNYCLGLEKIIISKSTTSVNRNAFRNCTSLKDVYYTGNAEDWEKVTVFNENNGNDFLLNATIHHNYVLCTHTNREKNPMMNATCYDDGYTEGVVCLDCGETLIGFERITAKHKDVNCDQICDFCKKEMPIDSGYCGNNCDSEVYLADPSVKYYIYSDGILEIYGSGTVATRSFSDDENINAILVKEGVVGMDNGVFYSCDNVTSVVIPSSLHSISDEVFDFCFSLKDVYYVGTRIEWFENVEIGKRNQPIYNATIHFLGEEEPHIHTEEIVPEVASTCTENGYTEGVKCSECGEIIVEPVEVITSGHNYVSVVTDATCTSKGFTTYTCTECEDSYISDETEKTPHVFDDDDEECQACGFDRTEECKCNCHKNGISSFFFKLILFFQKIFKTNMECSCGVHHY